MAQMNQKSTPFFRRMPLFRNQRHFPHRRATEDGLRSTPHVPVVLVVGSHPLPLTIRPYYARPRQRCSAHPRLRSQLGP